MTAKSKLAPGALRSIPGVGPRTEEDLRQLGIHWVSDLKGRDPQQLYDSLCRIHGVQLDRCVLYVFRCATYFASQRRHRPELLKWWNWKDAAASRKSAGNVRKKTASNTAR